MARTVKIVALVLAAVFCITAQAAAQNKVKLEIKGTQGELARYTLNVDGAMDMDLKELPFPHATTNIKNLLAGVEIDLFFNTLGVEEGVMTYDVKAMIDKITLGGLLELEGLGLKSTMLSPAITLAMDGTGKIQQLDMAEIELPTQGIPEIKGLSSLGFSPRDLNSFMPMLVGLLPSLLPQNEIAVGDTWKTEVNFDDMGMGGFLPRIPFSFTLAGLKDGVADITFTSDGTFDGAFLKSFLALIPEIPMGQDIVKIQDVNLKVKWTGAGAMKFNTAAGRIDDMAMKTDYDVVLAWKADFTHPDEKQEQWAADGDIKLTVDVGLKYAGAPTAEEILDLFPPAVEGEAGEDESGL